ncbi:MAG: hypothetical protein C4305_04195 [Thermoleophilia bacterium]
MATGRHLRGGAPASSGGGGASFSRCLRALLGYASVQTLQPEDRYGRLLAVYAAMFLIGGAAWGWSVDGKAFDRFEWRGASVAPVGVVIVL